MHYTALKGGEAFANSYGKTNKVVVDIGGKNVNGSLREIFEKQNMKYICVDIEEDPSVDIVLKIGEKLPFDTGSIDLVISTSCFEHDPCFWITFKEMTRIVKEDGYIYVNAPSNGPYHGYPGDNWRFYADAGQALAVWSTHKSCKEEEIFPVNVCESFFILPIFDLWKDFVCIWKRVSESDMENEIVLNKNRNIGLMEICLNNQSISTSHE